MKSCRCVRLVAILTLSFAIHTQAQGVEWHIERRQVQQIKATLTYQIHAPNINATEWLAFAAHPIALPSQTDVVASIHPRGSLTQELSPLRRPTLFARIPAIEELKTTPTDTTVFVRYSATLYSRRLVRGPGDTTVRALEDPERRIFLRASPSCDYAERGFQAWLTEKGLRRASDVPAIEFARRAAAVTRQALRYKYTREDDYSASSVCSNGFSTCGGISNFYVAILRANQVPARILAGRLAKSADGLNGSNHNRVEFFADGVGWIPVEITSAVSRKNSPLEDHFGVDAGDMIYFHADSDFVFDTDIGRKPMPFAQGIAYWVIGRGSWKNHTTEVKWRVSNVSKQSDE